MQDFPSSPIWNHINKTQWQDWQWQIKNSIKDKATLQSLLKLTSEEEAAMTKINEKFSFAITPHFFNLINRKDENCPLRKQLIPRLQEYDYQKIEMLDPCGENQAMPVPGLVHRYPEKVLFLVTDRCASYCRYCTRSRLVSSASPQKLITQWQQALNYIKSTPTIHDVLLSGGDPLLLSDNKINYLLEELRKIPHVYFIRIGTRIPIFLPQRITSNLVQVLQKNAPIFCSIHCNHPDEISLESKQALEQLANAGVVLGNQAVLLKGVNDSYETQKALSYQLLRCRVRPYYLYQCDLIRGSSHFRTAIAKGRKLIQQMQGNLPGYGMPTYVVDGPGGGGKIPLQKDNITQVTSKNFKLNNFEQREFLYPNENV